MSYFILNLDTTPPVIEISCPDYTTKREPLPIVILSNEDLDLWHDVFIIDSEGVRHDITLTHDGDRLFGSISFNAIASGVCTIFARARDEVFNVSNIDQKAVLVMADGAVILYITSSEDIRNVIISEHTREVYTSESVRAVLDNIATRDIETDEEVREIDVFIGE